MNFKVIGLTVETDGMTSEQLEQAKIFSGKNAGICYMQDSYFDSTVSDPNRALPRFKTTVNNAHHSIADHVRIEVVLEGISKMLAMVLNSLQDYATSEKSGRYTVMTGNSERECELYDKWCKIYEECILNEDPFIDPKLAKKLAQENARYVLSVFTRSTSMGYSTSLRQWNYIYDWCQKYLNQYMPRYDKDYVDAMAGGDSKVTIVYKGTDTPVSYFEEQLYFDLLKLSNFIYETMYVEDMRDTKDRCFEFLSQYSGVENHPMHKYDLSCFEPDGYTGEYLYDENTHSSDDYIGLVYNVSYTASFVQIAQAQRHRTLKYFMFSNFRVDGKDFFIPEIIRGSAYESEWIKDLKSVEDLVPQGMLVCVIETGHISDFILKCKERLCGRAQWEIMRQTKLTAERFLEVADKCETSEVVKSYVEQLRGKTNNVATKCELCKGCKEPCSYGAKHALDRKF